MDVSAALLRGFIAAVLAVAFVAIAQAFGIPLALDGTQFALSVAIVVGCVLTYGQLVRMSSKRG